jgi:hypothetical protein
MFGGGIMLTNRIGWLAKLSSPCFSRSRPSTVLCCDGWRRHSPGLAYLTLQSAACSNPLSPHARIDDSLHDACDGQQEDWNEHADLLLVRSKQTG